MEANHITFFIIKTGDNSYELIGLQERDVVESRALLVS